MSQKLQQGLKFRFETQAYQTKAVQAVVDVFKGQGAESAKILNFAQGSQLDLGITANQLELSAQAIDKNILEVQQKNGIFSKNINGFEMIFSKPCPTLEEMPPLPVRDLSISIEMETGTGKTYVFLKTIFELNKQYGFKKFVIVVPSIAIREGVMKSIDIMRDHFRALYKNVPFKEILYDSKYPNLLKSFAENNLLSILIINIDAFAKDENKINQAGERAFAPMDYLADTNPIVIIDEAQNFETPKRQEALKSLHPLCQIFYSATHKNAQNLLYSLNPVEAYRQGLVKKIEVNGNESFNDQNGPYLKLLSIKPDKSTATFEVDKNGKNGVVRGRISLKFGEDLFVKSKKREAYQNHYILSRISEKEITFDNGITLALGETQGGLSDDMMRIQIERTVAHHFEKAKILHPKGIKVLSLFFIDKVANYRIKDDIGEWVAGKFSEWFEEAFKKYQLKYPHLIPYDVSKVHDGYFAGDKKGNWKDSTERGNADDTNTYALIMQEKECLLSLETPLQFIFSHSALREGWDNPNVFQICTLNETQSQIKKRQEIGRGLRLCVNQKGERIGDERINVLTIIPNESYEKFAQALQEDIEQETGSKESLPLKNAKDRVKVKSDPLTKEERQLLHEIWERINYKASYRVALDSEKFRQRALSLFLDKGQYPKVQKAKILSETASVEMDQRGKIDLNVVDRRQFDATLMQRPEVPNIYKYIQERVDITRASLCFILRESGRLGELLDNPQGFLEVAVKILKTALLDQIEEGIQYERNGKTYEISLLEEDYITWRSEIFPDLESAQKLKKTLLKAHKIEHGKTGKSFSPCVQLDSQVEEEFALDCSSDEAVKFFFKLPRQYKIKTPLGNYNPDWAVIFEKEKRVYFVAETKSSLEEDERRGKENFKMVCGEKFFALAEKEDVRYKTVRSLEGLK
ncbi:DEAD/DEAH box helicase [Acetobacteraceae bacterium]|nr:DEAD/DEAH box helicase [Acetobacteraceae bacterium]